ncbi:MAG: rhodanese-like domain-containing protein [Spirochaetia bacterium]|jgi:rhodanese-related sulfurtransferase|nr:rhodanese-like domain-containing protein [Spirochaetia bacterium]
MKHIAKRILLVLLALSALPAFAFAQGQTESPQENNQAVYHTITPQEAKKRLDTDKDIILLDVRTESEFTQGHIPGAKNIPLQELSDVASAQLPNKDATIFVYCRSGNRSKTASKALVKLGYTQIYDLGGIIDWPYETVSP